MVWLLVCILLCLLIFKYLAILLIDTEEKSEWSNNKQFSKSHIAAQFQILSIFGCTPLSSEHSEIILKIQQIPNLLFHINAWNL